MTRNQGGKVPTGVLPEHPKPPRSGSTWSLAGATVEIWPHDEHTLDGPALGRVVDVVDMHGYVHLVVVLDE